MPYLLMDEFGCYVSVVGHMVKDIFQARIYNEPVDDLDRVCVDLFTHLQEQNSNLLRQKAALQSQILKNRVVMQCHCSHIFKNDVCVQCSKKLHREIGPCI